MCLAVRSAALLIVSGATFVVVRASVGHLCMVTFFWRVARCSCGLPNRLLARYLARGLSWRRSTSIVSLSGASSGPVLGSWLGGCRAGWLPCAKLCALRAARESVGLLRVACQGNGQQMWRACARGSSDVLLSALVILVPILFSFIRFVLSRSFPWLC